MPVSIKMNGTSKSCSTATWKPSILAQLLATTRPVAIKMSKLPTWAWCPTLIATGIRITTAFFIAKINIDSIFHKHLNYIKMSVMTCHK